MPIGQQSYSSSDFRLVTQRSLAWMRDVLGNAAAAHVLHWLKVRDEVCLARLGARNAAGAHQFATAAEEYREITRRFEPPQADEGFNLLLYR